MICKHWNRRLWALCIFSQHPTIHIYSQNTVFTVHFNLDPNIEVEFSMNTERMTPTIIPFDIKISQNNEDTQIIWSLYETSNITRTANDVANHNNNPIISGYHPLFNNETRSHIAPYLTHVSLKKVFISKFFVNLSFNIIRFE